ncbi:MAG: sigma-54 dependent transcriptional regulator [Bordetella sp.]|nr:sigma-54 dependent transcriptional regulator [Bordetella sp.]
MPARSSTPPPAARPSSPDPERLGVSEVMQQLNRQIERAAATDASVFIIGESGSGKELVARAIHAGSPRADRPFVAVNCGAISRSLAHALLFGHEKGSFTGAHSQNAGYFEHASGGTLFLDEVTEMSTDMQVHFLRVLETGTYQRVGGTDLLRANVRVICASNRDPLEAVEDGRLREDFLHRLLVVPLRVPPLRERPEDVPVLAQRMLDELNQTHRGKKRFAPAMLEALQRYDWPGNVRELKNIVQRAYIMADEEIGPEMAPRAAAPLADASDQLDFAVGTALADAQRSLILATLRQCGNDKQRAAQALGISVKTLYNRLAAYGASDA